MKANIFFASILIVFFAAQFNLPINNNRSSHYSKACYSKEEFPENSNDCSPFLNSFSKEEPLQKSEFAEYVRNNNDIILPADNGVLIIGRLTGETDNESFPSNNEAVFIINDRVPSQQQAYLEYDLFGLEDFTCVNRSINDLISQGGKIIRFRNEWSHQVEKIDVSDLQKGTNIIRFHTPEDTRFQYKIKNVSIRFAEPLSKKREIVINLPSNPAHYGQYAYINGFVFSGDTTSYTLLANGKTVSVFDSHFEDIVTLADTNNPTVELTVFFNDGKTCSTTIVYNEDKKYHYLSNNTWVVPFYKTSVFPKKNNYVNFKGISIITEENAVKNKKEISIIGLRNEDMPQMGAGMVNVTAEYKGYRCLPHETKFETSVDVHLSYDSLLLPRNYTTEDIRTFHYNKSKRSWEMIEYVGIDKDKKQIISKAYQFDDFINAVLKTPDLPQTSGYTPTTMKNMAYADPVAHVNIIAPPKANNMGTANLSYQINIPAGRQGLQPQLSVVYNSEKNTGIPGNGWDIPFTNISVETRWGVPSYDNTKETEEYLLNGEQLVELQIEGGDTNRLPLVHTTAFRNRNTSDVTYYAYRVEGAFSRIIRHGTNPTNYWWEVVDKNGTTYIYSYNCISKWHLAEVRDLYGNNINYEYASNCNLNPDKIYYTGHDSIKGIYSVEFLHGDLSADIRTSARSGFLENENAPIEQVLIKCKNEFIKGYFFKYKTGAYNKKLLCAIVDYTDSSTVESIREKDCDQLQTDYIHGTQTHIFQYYEDEGLDFQTSPTTIFAEAESDEKAFGLFTDPNHQTIGRSKSLTLGAGGSICLGFGKEIFSKKNSVGANINFSYSPLTEKVQLLDINGDGLLDKVVKHNSDYKLYPGYLNGSNELYFNSSSSTISGLSKLSRSSNITWGLGLEAQWNFLGALHGSLSLSKSWNKQTSDRYFVDINGDGFVDFIKQGSIYNNVNGTFSVVDDNGIIKSPDDSCYFTTYTGTIDSSFYSQESESTFSFRRDPVKFWIAPTTTDVLIKSYIKRINPSNSNKRIIYNIQVGNSIILTDSIEPNDTIIHFDSICPISVSAGTPVFFHMHSTNPIGSDEIAWVPSVYIVKSCQPSTVQYDADENTVNRYNYSKDALLSDQQYFMAPLKGHIILNGHISSPAQSDTLTFIIKHNQSLLTDTIFPDNQSFNHNFNYDLSVNENDSVLFKLNSNTNVNWTDIDFQAKVQYYQADSFPALDTSNAYLSVEPYYPSLQMSAFPRAAVISTPHYFTADTFSFSPNITFTNNNSVNGQVVVTAKSKRKLLCKKNLTLINGIIQNPPIINLNLNSGDTICFDFFTTNINIGEKVVSANVTALDTNLSYPSGFYYLFPDSLKKFGNLYRQWGQFSFYDTLNPLFIDQSKCFNAFPDSAALNNIPVGSIDTTSTYDDVNDIFSSLGVHDVNSIYFMPLMVNNKEKRWDDLMKSVCISPLTIINQDGFQYIYNNIANDTLFDDDIPSPDLEAPDVFQSANNHLPTIKKASKQVSYSFSFSLSNPSNNSLSKTVSVTNSIGKLDFMDMNGDRYPDIVGNKKIQYSSPQGGISSYTANFGSLDLSKGKGTTVGTSIGIKTILFKNTKPSDGSKSRLNDIDGASTIGTTSGTFSTNYTLMDINGDGLPDKLDKNSNKVSINTGYDFLAETTWTLPQISTTNSNSTSLGLNLTFDFRKHSWSFGIGGSNNVSQDAASFMDVNNDGLLDVCYVAGNQLYAYINMGSSFESSPTLLSSNYSNLLSKTNSNNLGINAAFTFGMMISAAKLTFTPYIDISYSINSTKNRLMDLNGDNVPDFVYIDGNEVKVKYGIIKKTNVLKKVITPLKSSYTLNYDVVYPSQNYTGSRQVMSSLKVFDGFTGDGEDTTSYTFSYHNPYYHRMERDFFGFETVGTSQGNHLYNEKYYIGNYLFKGIKKYESVNNPEYIETYYTYDYKDISTGNIIDPSQLHCPCTIYPAISQEDRYYYEGQETCGIHTKKTYRHTSCGNIKEYFNYGDTAYTDDDVKVNLYYSYDLTKNLTGMVSEMDVYDSQNNLLQKRTGTYNSNGKITEINNYLDANTAATTDISYDSYYGNISQIEFPENVNSERLLYSYDYDSVANIYPIKITDFWGNYSTSVYDLKLGLPTEQNDLAGNKIQYSYFDDGKLKSVTGPYEINTSHHTIDCEYWDEHAGNANYWARTYHFDPLDTTNLMLTTNFADGLKHNIQSKKKSTVDGTDKMVVSGKVIYDSYGRVQKVYLPITENLGLDTVYNSNNNEYFAETTYDVMDRPLQQTMPDNTIYTYTYDFGNDYFGKKCFQQTTTDPLSNVITKFTNGVGKNTSVTAPLSITTAFSYDPLGQLTQSLDPESNITTYQYDMLGRMTQRVHPDAGTTINTYDPAGNILSRQTQNLIDNSEQIDYIYDNNRLVNIVYPENPEMNVYYQYGQTGSGNQTGRIIEEQDASGAQTFTYGKLGEVINNVHTFVVPGGSSYIFSTSWDYDTWGRTKSIEYPDGEIVHYGYNHGGNLDTMTSVKGGDDYYFIKHINYNEYGKRIMINYSNNVVTKYTYNEMNQRLTNLKTVDGDTTLQDITYNYDQVGNILDLENTGGYKNFIGGQYNYNFNYDELYRLTNSSGGFTPYGMDPISFDLTNMGYSNSGNIIEKDLVATTLIDGNSSYIADNNTYEYNDRPHTFTMAGKNPYSWDNNGNMVWKGYSTGLHRSLCWDEENRLNAVGEFNGEISWIGRKISMYLYDSGGERTWKLAGAARTMLINGHMVSNYTKIYKTLYVNPYMVMDEYDYTKNYYAESERVASKIGSGFGVAPILPTDDTLTFIYGDASSLASDLATWKSRQMSCVGYIGGTNTMSTTLPPATNENNDVETYQYFYHPDHLGSASFVTDNNAEAVQHLLYMPFGEQFVLQTAGDFDSRYKFSGKELDNETNYNYFGARYYDSELSNWLSVDPMSDKYPNHSPFNYCANNPIRFIDPNGMYEIPKEMENNESYKNTVLFFKNVQALWNGTETSDEFKKVFGNSLNYLFTDKEKSAFMEVSGLSESQVQEMLMYGSGPQITGMEDIDESDRLVNGTTVNQRNEAKNADIDGNGTFRGLIKLDDNIVNQFETYNGNANAYASGGLKTTLEKTIKSNFGLVSTTFHESVHYGRFKVNLPNNLINGNCQGTYFEMKAYGISKDFIKRINNE